MMLLSCRVCRKRERSRLLANVEVRLVRLNVAMLGVLSLKNVADVYSVQ